MRPALISILSLTAFCANATDIVYETFAGGMPKSFSTADTDGAPIKPNIYAHTEGDGGWFVGNIGGSGGRAALSPTRNDGDVAAEHWLILPAFKVEDENVRLTWDARSMHKHLLDSYKVMVRKAGTEAWTQELEVEAETHSWSTRSICIEQYAGEEIEVAFVATSSDGFLLAIDNVNVFRIDEHAPKLSAKSLNQKFFGEDDEVVLKISVNNTGNTALLTSIKVMHEGDEIAQISDPLMWHGLLEERTYNIPISAPLNEKYEYIVVATTDSGDDIILLASDWVYRSHYARTSVVDRGSGTWCNNCPVMELTMTRLEDIYGRQLIPVEAHVNDLLASSTYSAEYLSTFIYSIPTLVPNHQKDKITNSLKSTDDFSQALIEPTIAAVKAEYTVSEDGLYTIYADTEFAFDTDNSDGRYKLGYMLVANMRNATYGGFLQRNSASSYRQEQFYYMPSNVMPEIMVFDNVPIHCTYATHGCDHSLPATIPAKETLPHQLTLSADISGSAIPVESLLSVTPIVMIIDTATGAYLNSTVATEKKNPGAVTDITEDSITEDPAWYTLQGIRLDSKPSARGIYIHHNKLVKI